MAKILILSLLLCVSRECLGNMCLFKQGKPDGVIEDANTKMKNAIDCTAVCKDQFSSWNLNYNGVAMMSTNDGFQCYCVQKMTSSNSTCKDCKEWFSCKYAKALIDNPSKTYTRGLNGKYYKRYNEAKNWQTALSTCLADYATLAIVDSPLAEKSIMKLFKSKFPQWIGGAINLNVNMGFFYGMWKWTNLQKIDTPTYWKSGKHVIPMFQAKSVSIAADGKWVALDPFYELPFICQRETENACSIDGMRWYDQLTCFQNIIDVETCDEMCSTSKTCKAWTYYTNTYEIEKRRKQCCFEKNSPTIDGGSKLIYSAGAISGAKNCLMVQKKITKDEIN